MKIGRIFALFIDKESFSSLIRIPLIDGLPINNYCLKYNLNKFTEHSDFLKSGIN